MKQLLNLKHTMKPNANRHIGIFDSGLGGLTVLKQLKHQLPNEKFIYFGDTAHVPYGNKSADTINNYVMQIANFLIQQNVKLIIIACNTASSVSLKKIRQKIAVPSIDVITPSITAISKLTNIKTIGVIGTETTINSLAYQNQIKKINHQYNVIAQPCSLFVPLIEEGLSNHSLADAVVKMYLDNNFCSKIDALILGCTHYPMLKDKIAQYLNNSQHIIDSSTATAQYVKQYLNTNRLTIEDSNTLRDQFYVSDKVSRFNEIASMFLNEQIINIQQIDLQ